MNTLVNKKISVIICTYNRHEFLKHAVESVLNQTYQNLELVIVNNGSTDETDILCEYYKKKDKRVRKISIDKNIGASHGRNIGIKEVNTEYLTFVDDDDICEPIMLEKLVELQSEYDADISVCGGWNDFNGKLESYFIYDEILILDKVSGLDELLKREKYNVAPPAKLFKKDLFEKIKFENGVLVDDIHTIYKVFAKANRVVASGIPVYRWRKHTSNMTGFIETSKLTPAILEEYLMMQKERVSYLTKHVPHITERVCYSEWSYMISMCDKIKNYDLVECKQQYICMIRLLNKNFKKFINSPFITKRERELLRVHIGR